MNTTQDDRITGGSGLQQLIDSYNSELMRIHRRTEETQVSASPNEAEHPHSSIALDDGNNECAEPAACPADAPEAPQPDSQDDEQQKQWLLELEKGLAELKQGLIELAKGQKELADGIREWKEGMAEAGWDSPPDTPDSGSGAQPEPGRQPDPDIKRGSGTLRVSVFTARQAVPIRGASVVVTRPDGAPGGSEAFLSMTMTDGSGLSPVIELPAADIDTPSARTTMATR